ncbi:MAG: glycosyltransferase family 4 protein [Rhodobacteraceae bacterium]|nr:glycosyltransferase family 4 protein [Paracoccaceae bacterium]TVR47279.1 MAG: glycosyltransferase [Paracoccaceae bacterium]
MEAAFAIPGDLNTRTGGYIYERRLLESLNEIGQPTRHVRLITSWPHPTPEAEADLARALAALPDGMPLILDGLVFGAMDTDILARTQRPVIAMLHHPLGLEAGLPPDRAKALIARETANLRHAAHVVVPSPHTREILVAQFGVEPGRISIALPGFDRPSQGGPMDKAIPPLILSVGIICARKGHDILIDALARVAHLDWTCSIVGMTHDEGVRQALLAQRARLHLDHRVVFEGVVPTARLDQLYRQATLFALATRYEGYGLVLSEAQLYGLPILSCAVGAVPQTVPDGAALLTPPDDPAAFAAALERLLTDAAERKRLANESAARSTALPHWRDTARVMRQVVQHVAAPGV